MDNMTAEVIDVDKHEIDKRISEKERTINEKIFSLIKNNPGVKRSIKLYAWTLTTMKIFKQNVIWKKKSKLSKFKYDLTQVAIDIAMIINSLKDPENDNLAFEDLAVADPHLSFGQAREIFYDYAKDNKIMASVFQIYKFAKASNNRMFTGKQLIKKLGI